MALKKDMKGLRFGHLTVIAESTLKNAKYQTYWICRCDCGNYLRVRGDNLRRGNSRRCSDCKHITRGIQSNFLSKSEERVFENESLQRVCPNKRQKPTH